MLDSTEAEGKSKPTSAENLLRTRDQLRVIKEMSESGLPIFLAGGFAEDAVMAGQVTRIHGDIDIGALRENEDTIISFYEDTGFKVKPKRMPYGLSQRFYGLERNGINLELTIYDTSPGRLYFETYDYVILNDRYRIYFSRKEFTSPDQRLDDLQHITALSPLAQIQHRSAIRLIHLERETDENQKALIAKYFPGESVTSEKFKPKVIKIMNSRKNTWRR